MQPLSNFAKYGIVAIVGLIVFSHAFCSRQSGEVDDLQRMSEDQDRRLEEIRDLLDKN